MPTITDEVSTLIARAREAQPELEACNQDQVDAAVKGIGKIVYDRAAELARMAVDETRMGVYEDKIAKNRGKSRNIWNHLKDKPTVGIVGRDESLGLIYLAKPVGVVGAIAPCTNPIVTPMCNAMFALKGRNAVIIAPHPRAKECTRYLVQLWGDHLESLGLPRELVQAIAEPSVEGTSDLMGQADVVVATGGMGMVKSAYSSGKPALGVGAGNVQCIVDRDIDLSEAIDKIITGAQFDNGIICSSEQSIIYPREQHRELSKALEATERVYYAEDPELVDKFRSVLFDREKGTMNKDVVGQSPSQIGQLADVDISETCRAIVLLGLGAGEKDILCKEKLCPALVALPYDSFEEAVEIAQLNLEYEGKGHSAAVHSLNQAHIEYAGLHLKVSRLVVNQPSSLTAGGSLTNGLAPTTTLGCGSWGNNSISENLDYKHLINVSRIAMPITHSQVPTDEEIWG